MKKKDMYVSPQLEVIEMENEGVIAASGGVNGMPNNNWAPKSSSNTYSGSRASSSDIEDMLNDILTIEN